MNNANPAGVMSGTRQVLAGGLGTATATIAAAASLSAAIDLGNGRLHAVVMPAAWDAAGLSFEASIDDVDYFPIHNADGEYTIAAGASLVIVVDPALFYGFQHIKVRSGTSAAAVAQAAERELELVLVDR